MFSVNTSGNSSRNREYPELFESFTLKSSIIELWLEQSLFNPSSSNVSPNSAQFLDLTVLDPILDILTIQQNQQFNNSLTHFQSQYPQLTLSLQTVVHLILNRSKATLETALLSIKYGYSAYLLQTITGSRHPLTACYQAFMEDMEDVQNTGNLHHYQSVKKQGKSVDLSQYYLIPDHNLMKNVIISNIIPIFIDIYISSLVKNANKNNEHNTNNPLNTSIFCSKYLLYQIYEKLPFKTTTLVNQFCANPPINSNFSHDTNDMVINTSGGGYLNGLFYQLNESGQYVQNVSEKCDDIQRNRHPSDYIMQVTVSKQCESFIFDLFTAIAMKEQKLLTLYPHVQQKFTENNPQFSMYDKECKKIVNHFIEHFPLTEALALLSSKQSLYLSASVYLDLFVILFARLSKFSTLLSLLTVPSMKMFLNSPQTSKSEADPSQNTIEDNENCSQNCQDNLSTSSEFLHSQCKHSLLTLLSNDHNITSQFTLPHAPSLNHLFMTFINTPSLEESNNTHNLSNEFSTIISHFLSDFNQNNTILIPKSSLLQYIITPPHSQVRERNQQKSTEMARIPYTSTPCGSFLIFFVISLYHFCNKTINRFIIHNNLYYQGLLSTSLSFTHTLNSMKLSNQLQLQQISQLSAQYAISQSIYQLYSSLITSSSHKFPSEVALSLDLHQKNSPNSTQVPSTLAPTTLTPYNIMILSQQQLHQQSSEANSKENQYANQFISSYLRFSSILNDIPTRLILSSNTSVYNQNLLVKSQINASFTENISEGENNFNHFPQNQNSLNIVGNLPSDMSYNYNILLLLPTTLHPQGVYSSSASTTSTSAFVCDENVIGKSNLSVTDQTNGLREHLNDIITAQLTRYNPFDEDFDGVPKQSLNSMDYCDMLDSDSDIDVSDLFDSISCVETAIIENSTIKNPTLYNIENISNTLQNPIESTQNTSKFPLVYALNPSILTDSLYHYIQQQQQQQHTYSNHLTSNINTLYIPSLLFSIRPMGIVNLISSASTIDFLDVYTKHLAISLFNKMMTLFNLTQYTTTQNTSNFIQYVRAYLQQQQKQQSNNLNNLEKSGNPKHDDIHANFVNTTFSTEFLSQIKDYFLNCIYNAENKYLEQQKQQQQSQQYNLFIFDNINPFLTHLYSVISSTSTSTIILKQFILDKIQQVLLVLVYILNIFVEWALTPLFLKKQSILQHSRRSSTPFNVVPSSTNMSSCMLHYNPSSFFHQYGDHTQSIAFPPPLSQKTEEHSPTFDDNQAIFTGNGQYIAKILYSALNQISRENRLKNRWENTQSGIFSNNTIFDKANQHRNTNIPNGKVKETYYKTYLPYNIIILSHLFNFTHRFTSLLSTYLESKHDFAAKFDYNPQLNINALLTQINNNKAIFNIIHPHLLPKFQNLNRKTSQQQQQHPQTSRQQMLFYYILSQTNIAIYFIKQWLTFSLFSAMFNNIQLSLSLLLYSPIPSTPLLSTSTPVSTDSDVKFPAQSQIPRFLSYSMTQIQFILTTILPKFFLFDGDHSPPILTSMSASTNTQDDTQQEQERHNQSYAQLYDITQQYMNFKNTFQIIKYTHSHSTQSTPLQIQNPSTPTQFSFLTHSIIMILQRYITLSCTHLSSPQNISETEAVIPTSDENRQYSINFYQHKRDYLKYYFEIFTSRVIGNLSAILPLSYARYVKSYNLQEFTTPFGMKKQEDNENSAQILMKNDNNSLSPIYNSTINIVELKKSLGCNSTVDSCVNNIISSSNTNDTGYIQTLSLLHRSFLMLLSLNSKQRLNFSLMLLLLSYYKENNQSITHIGQFENNSTNLTTFIEQISKRLYNISGGVAIKSQSNQLQQQTIISRLSPHNITNATQYLKNILNKTFDPENALKSSDQNQSQYFEPLSVLSTLTLLDLLYYNVSCLNDKYCHLLSPSNREVTTNIVSLSHPIHREIAPSSDNPDGNEEIYATPAEYIDMVDKAVNYSSLYMNRYELLAFQSNNAMDDKNSADITTTDDESVQEYPSSQKHKNEKKNLSDKGVDIYQYSSLCDIYQSPEVISKIVQVILNNIILCYSPLIFPTAQSDSNTQIENIHHIKHAVINMISYIITKTHNDHTQLLYNPHDDTQLDRSDVIYQSLITIPMASTKTQENSLINRQNSSTTLNHAAMSGILQDVTSVYLIGTVLLNELTRS